MATTAPAEAQEIEIPEDEQPQPELTPWMRAAIDDFNAGVSHVFLVHGNVFDYTLPDGSRLTARMQIHASLALQATTVMYSPDEGIWFPGPDEIAGPARTRFDAVLGRLGGELENLTPAQKIARAAVPSSDDDDALPSAPSQALPLLVKFLEKADFGDETGKVGVVIIDRADLLFPPADKALMSAGDRAILSLFHRAGANRSINARRNMLFLLAPTLEDLHPDLRTAAAANRAIEIAMPDYDARLAFLKSELELPDAVPVLLDDIAESELAATTAGLGLRSIEDIVLRARAAADVRAGDPGVLTRAMVKARKNELMSLEYAEVLETLDSVVTLDMVGGHDLAKEYVRVWVLQTMNKPEFADLAPLGILLLGPSGTGKTLLSKAIAFESGLNCILLRPNKIKGGIVGESERRLAKALAGIEALAPCLVFIDEVDQSMPRRVERSGGDGGSAVEAAAFGRLLEFMAQPDHRGRILFVGASNRPNLIDAAMMRPGRFGDLKIPLLPPVDAGERVAVIKTLMQRNDMEVTEGVIGALESIGVATDGWTQAELEGLVIKARGLARLTNLPIPQALQTALSRMRPSTREIESMSREAIDACDDTSVIPERWRGYLDTSTQPVTGGSSKPDTKPEPPSGRRDGRRTLEL
jgi:transitional endoplasmic reticulum ATPase